MENIQEIIQKIRSDFVLINMREIVEQQMRLHDLHMEDIVEIGGTDYIYDGTTEEFFGMLEYYYDEIATDALMFEICFEDGSRIYTDVDEDYNVVLVNYEMPPKHREIAYFENTFPFEIERKIIRYINDKDPEQIEEVLRILRIPVTSPLLAKLPDKDQ